MTAGDAGQLLAWLADPRVAAVDPDVVRDLRARLSAGTDARPRLDVDPHGTVVVRDAIVPGHPRRVLELDRHGTVLSALRWAADGRLVHAWTRLDDGSWLMIEPRATDDSPWGAVDRLWHAAHPSAESRVALTVFEALAYERVDRIPTLAEPSRLPAGGGTVVLNLIAALAADAADTALVYRGPYPTEQLFLALLESFRYRTTDADVLPAFMRGGVEWTPAPHERVALGDAVTVRLRRRIETVAWRGRRYQRPDWQDIGRHAARRVRDTPDGGVVCSLWALGEPLEDHLRLDAAGTAVEVIAPPPVDAPSRPVPATVMRGIASAAAALSATALGGFVREIGAGCELAWAPLDRDLVDVDGGGLRASVIFRRALERRLRAASTRAERLAVALGGLTELAHLFGDVLRARAQARVAALPENAQATLVSTPPPADAGIAQDIAVGVEALLADLTPDA